MLSFERRGTGIPLIFLHAFPLNQSMWEEQISVLSKNFQIITMDLPGFGNSPLQKETSTMEDMAQAVLDLLAELKVTDKCIFTGLSMGGYVLFQILKKAPEKIRAMAFVSTRAAADSEEAKARRFKTIETLEKQGIAPLVETMRPALLGKTSLAEQPKLVGEIESMIRGEKVPGVCAALRGMAARPDSTPLLSTIRVPTLFLSGAEDTVVPTAEMEKMAGLVVKADFRRVEAAGHLLNMEKPTVFNDQFATFLKRRVL
jgi:3-oxoadipate enol-lactonase